MARAVKPLVTTRALKAWMQGSAVGERIIYHRAPKGGFIDSRVINACGEEETKHNASAELFELAARYYGQKEATLFQRRHPNGSIDYILQRVSPGVLVRLERGARRA